MNRLSCALQKTLRAAVLLSAFTISAQEADILSNASQDRMTIISAVHSYDLNPHTASYNSESQILSGLYEGLFSYDPVTLEPQYALATSYKISRDSRRWTFTLREGACFSDGTPITAACVKNSWLTLLSTQNAPFSSLFDIVSGAQEYRTGNGTADSVGIYDMDDQTLSLHLTAPASYLPKLLCMTAFTVTGEAPGVYSGPFVLSELNEQNAVLTKNKLYYDAEKTLLEKITFIFSDDAEENAFLFNTGLADWITGSVNLSKILEKNAPHITAEFATEYLFFKMRGTIWNNAEFRQALLEAVPWEKLRENTFVPAATLVYPLSGYPAVRGYSYTDEIEAASLMKQARKNAGIPDGKPLEIVMAVSESEYMKKKAGILKDAWKNLNVELTTIEIPSDQYLYSIPETEADIFSYTWIGDFSDPLAFLELFRGNSTLNVSSWCNDEYDRLLNESALYTDEKHNALLGQAEQLLMDEAVVLPIQHPVSLNIIDLNIIGGWAQNAFDIHPLKYLFKKDSAPDVPNVVLR